jgi:hypothetical protein
MDLQRIAAAICVVAGTAVLIGYGWALIVAGGLLFLAPRNSVLSVAWQGIQNGWAALVASKTLRWAVAAPIALVVFAVGIGAAVGLGWGLASAGASVGALSLYVDRVG